MEYIGDISFAFYCGLIHGLRGFLAVGPAFFIYFKTKFFNEKNKEGLTPKEIEETKVNNRLVKIIFLNFGIFICSGLMYTYLIIPAVKYIVLMSIYGPALWRFLEFFLNALFKTCWVVPLYALNKVINFFWCQDIADSSYRRYQGRPQSMSSISKLIADSLFSVVIQMMFLGQATVMSFLPIPILADVISYIHVSMLYSLYAFEYRWLNQGWELHRRLTFIENNWPYFIGFGLPLAFVTRYLDEDMFISGSIFATFFPVIIISSTNASPKMIDKRAYAMRLFSPVVAISNFVMNTVVKHKIFAKR